MKLVAQTMMYCAFSLAFACGGEHLPGTVEDTQDASTDQDTQGGHTDTGSLGQSTGATADSAGTDPVSDSETQPDTNPNPCPEGQHAGCYGEEVWCLDQDETPVSVMEVCAAPKRCIERSLVYAECGCDYEEAKTCHNGDIWLRDGCGAWIKRLQACGQDTPCTQTNDDEFSCCSPAGGHFCDEDGNVRETWACEQGTVPGRLKDVCYKGFRGECKSLSGNQAACGCHNHWSGPTCDVCTSNFKGEDCDRCSGAWKGENCDVCDGYGDNCQCPSDEYLPVEGTDLCIACLPPDKVEKDGRCYLAFGSARTLSQAQDSSLCPEGFVLPSIRRLSAMYNNCKFNGFWEDTKCDYCDDSPKCAQAPIGPYSIIWTSDECRTSFYSRTNDGVVAFSIELGRMDDCISPKNTHEQNYVFCIYDDHKE